VLNAGSDSCRRSTLVTTVRKRYLAWV